MGDALAIAAVAHEVVRGADGVRREELSQVAHGVAVERKPGHAVIGVGELDPRHGGKGDWGWGWDLGLSGIGNRESVNRGRFSLASGLWPLASVAAPTAPLHRASHPVPATARRDGAGLGGWSATMLSNAPASHSERTAPWSTPERLTKSSNVGERPVSQRPLELFARDGPSPRTRRRPSRTTGIGNRESGIVSGLLWALGLVCSCGLRPLASGLIRTTPPEGTTTRPSPSSSE